MTGEYRDHVAFVDQLSWLIDVSTLTADVEFIAHRADVVDRQTHPLVVEVDRSSLIDDLPDTYWNGFRNEYREELCDASRTLGVSLDAAPKLPDSLSGSASVSQGEF